MLIQHVGNTAPAMLAGNFINDRLSENGKPAFIPSKTDALPQLSPDQLKNTVTKFNDVMKQSKQNLEFSVDTETKKPLIKLVDSVTGELIRQIPSEEMLAIARSIDQFQQGMLLSQKA